MKKNNAFRRAAALMAALSITVSLAVPAFAGTYYIDNGDITVTKNADGSQTVEQNGTSNNDSDEIIITTTGAAITTLESDLEGPAAEDTDFGLWRKTTTSRPSRRALRNRKVQTSRRAPRNRKAPTSMKALSRISPAGSPGCCPRRLYSGEPKG